MTWRILEGDCTIRLLSPEYAEMARKSLETDRSRDGTASLLNVEEVMSKHTGT